VLHQQVALSALASSLTAPATIRSIDVEAGIGFHLRNATTGPPADHLQNSLRFFSPRGEAFVDDCAQEPRVQSAPLPSAHGQFFKGERGQGLLWPARLGGHGGHPQNSEIGCNARNLNGEYWNQGTDRFRAAARDRAQQILAA